jgi:DNA-binding winged helix-turn-helix (wHTH) protein
MKTSQINGLRNAAIGRTVLIARLAALCCELRPVAATRAGRFGVGINGVDARVAGEILAFEDWRFERQTRLLYRQDVAGSWTPVPIGSRAQDVLTLLLEQPGALVSKDTIMEAVWPNTAVEANNLNAQIAALRRVLDADRTGSSYIQTVSGRGYRFAVPVRLQEEVPGPSQAPPIDHDATDHLQRAEAGGDPIVPAPDTSAATHLFLGSGPFTRHRRGAVRSALLAGLCLVVATSVYFGPFHSLWFAGPAERPRLSLVVLPFANLSGDPKDDYLAYGINRRSHQRSVTYPRCLCHRPRICLHLRPKADGRAQDRRGAWRALCA